MQKIVPHLWFDKEAKEAAAFYTSVFPESKVTHTVTITNTPSGDCDIVSFDILGYSFQAISAGPYFKPNPAISIMVNFDPSQDPNAKENLDAIWNKLIEGGKALMPLDTYPFSQRYGWVEDKYGFTWQLILTDPKGEKRPRVIPSLLFTQEVNKKAIEATDYYISVFKDAARGVVAPYPVGSGDDKEGGVMFTDFKLLNQWFVAMDGGLDHNFAFNESLSLIVHCDSQEEIDYFWEKLSAVPESEQCGWVKDKYKVSWQIVPKVMDDMMKSNDQAKIDRVTQAMLKMKKLDIAALEAAAAGN